MSIRPESSRAAVEHATFNPRPNSQQAQEYLYRNENKILVSAVHNSLIGCIAMNRFL